MNTKKVTEEYRLSQWAQVIQARQDSGQNIKDFCESTGIRRNKYFYWQKKLRSEACTELAKTEESRNIVPGGWMQLESKQTQDIKEALDIEINGFHITFTAGTNTELLKKACCTLRSL
jgi:putative transposase